MSSLDRREELLKQVVLSAVASPPSLFLGTLGILLATSPVTWPVGAAALAADVVWLWCRIRDPRQARASGENLLRQRWRSVITRLEELAPALDRHTGAALAAIVESQERLISLCDSSPALLPHSRAEMTALMEHCLSLAEKRHRLHGYLAAYHSQDLQRHATQLQSRLERTPDPVTRQLYEQALEQKRQELENYVRLEEAVSRIDGQLTAVQCTFDCMLSRVVRMQSGEIATNDVVSDPLASELNRLTGSVAALEASVNEILTVRGAA